MWPGQPTTAVVAHIARICSNPGDGTFYPLSPPSPLSRCPVSCPPAPPSLLHTHTQGAVEEICLALIGQGRVPSPREERELDNLPLRDRSPWTRPRARPREQRRSSSFEDSA